MPHNARVEELVEQIMESEISTEEACRFEPSLLPAVVVRLEQIRAVALQVDSLFPSRERAAWPASATFPSGAALPTVPGYDIEDVLGRGGVGVVYKATQLSLHRSVALKMLLVGSYASQLELARFTREAKALAALRHPNIVQIYDVGQVDGRPFFTMEFVDGGTLGQRFASAPHSVRDAAKVIATLASAVQAAHDLGIIHRDLKPANILLTADGELRITDFGLARRVDDATALTRTGARMGTPSYMAPEQVLGTTLTVSADIYALGALLYEMLTGRPPFRASSFAEIERQLLNDQVVPPSRLNPKTPRDLDTICLKCLEKDPQRRYATSDDLAADVERFLRHEPIHARPLSRTKRFVRWGRRNPSLAAVFLMFTAFLGLLAVEGSREVAFAAGRRAEKARLTARLESGLELMRAEKFSEADALLGKLGDGGFADLRERIDSALSHLKLVEDLGLVTIRRVSACKMLGRSAQTNRDAERSYEALFQNAGLAAISDTPQEVATRIRQMDTHNALLAAMDDWAASTLDLDRREWLLEITRNADPDPRGWRGQARNSENWAKPQALLSLSQTDFDGEVSVELLCLLADRMDAAGIDSLSFRRKIQRERPDDFLANMVLADALRSESPDEAIRFLQATVAISPHVPAAHTKLGATLLSLGRYDEARESLEKALLLNPDSEIARTYLAKF
ncbi:Serine/threonine-protein kinase PknB [Stieleria maiorica]|uniref:non-specific serine/threonine protein kinase n=1 Tax=Stieleria maiorica TaxID=2795974 RepID=A0A5B9MKH3_9BACT|nr:serine/threonine-protein kinase [Stieleria maiorica]QEG01782.1 Serine/threonine-protein kinase PknB [Stieleria maiorica]